MMKNLYKFLFFMIIIIFGFPNIVNANYGDLNYRITSVSIEQKKITFRGWSYIHRTNNFAKHATLGTGDQKVLMRAYDNAGNVVETVVYSAIDESDETFDSYNNVDYNFYCDMFYMSGDGGPDCEKSDYLNKNYNRCINKDDGTGDYSQCLYEDMSFTITFDTSTWGDVGDVSFRIGVSNSDFENKVAKYPGNSFQWNGDKYTALEDVFITTDANINFFSNEYIRIDVDSISDYVDFVASYGTLYLCNNTNGCYSESDFKWNSGAYGTWKIGNNSYKGGCTNNRYRVAEINGKYYASASAQPSGIHGSRMQRYYIHTSRSGQDSSIFCPGNDSIVIAYGAHVKVTGINIFNIDTNPESKPEPDTNPEPNPNQNSYKCSISQPDNSNLSCNTSRELSSTCEHLTVKTSAGAADVIIEQKGSLSTVLTPSRIYAGGGFSLGLLYTNTIKWNYIDGNKPNYHDSINSSMNDRIKEVNAYIAGINISNLKIGDKAFNLIKNCSYNRTNNYYNDELIVTCLFSIPNSNNNLDGSVTYGSLSDNINNKYYTGLDYNGKYNINAKIVGLDRIKANEAKNDSEDGKSPWTGNWDIDLNCSIDVYSLLINNDDLKGVKYYYRPVDLINMFPDRNPGINWFEWYKDSANKERLANTYKNGYQYQVVLNNKKITEIKEYNSSRNYLEWDSIDFDTYESLFVDKYVKRGAGGY